MICPLLKDKYGLIPTNFVDISYFKNLFSRYFCFYFQTSCFSWCYYFLKKLVSSGLKNSMTFGHVNVVVESMLVEWTLVTAEARKYLKLFINERKWADSLFTSGLWHNFKLVKVNYLYLTDWALHITKFHSSHSKRLIWIQKLELL